MSSPGSRARRRTITARRSTFVRCTAVHVPACLPVFGASGDGCDEAPGQVDGAVVRRRAAELRASGDALAEAYRARRVGGTADVVVVRGDRREGLTEDYLQVDVDGPRLPRGTRLSAHLAEGSRPPHRHPDLIP